MDNNDKCDAARCWGTRLCRKIADGQSVGPPEHVGTLPCEWKELAAVPSAVLLSPPSGEFYPTWLTENYRIRDDS